MYTCTREDSFHSLPFTLHFTRVNTLIRQITSNPNVELTQYYSLVQVVKRDGTICNPSYQMTPRVIPRVTGILFQLQLTHF